MKVHKCTLTGVDDSTSPTGLQFLSLQYPFVEWGILYSPVRAGAGGRYPSTQTIKKIVTLKPMHTANMAIHICGAGVKDFIEGETVVTELITALNERGGRVQLNFNYAKKPFSIVRLSDKIREFPRIQFIAQIHGGNASVIKDLHDIGIVFLHDQSGGRGELPVDWQAPVGSFCGYAGGLSPDNVSSELERIAKVIDEAPEFGPRFWIWIDMESKLRDENDKFSLFECYIDLDWLDKGW